MVEPSRDQDRATHFVELLTASQRELFSYINALIGGDPSASDVLQDTNLDLWARMEDYEADRPFLPWAFGFAFQRVMAFRKSQRRSRLLFSDEVVALLSDAYVDEVFEGDSRLSALRECLEKLAPDQKKLVWERYHAKTAVKTLAEQYNSNVNLISARLFRIRKSLQKCIVMASRERA